MEKVWLLIVEDSKLSDYLPPPVLGRVPPSISLVDSPLSSSKVSIGIEGMLPVPKVHSFLEFLVVSMIMNVDGGKYT